MTPRGRPGDPSTALIAISRGGLADKPWEVTWQSVSWTGDTLAAGERAAQRAVECLDEAAASVAH